MSSFIIFCAFAAIAAMFPASVGATDVSVVGVPGVFTAPHGRSCGGSDLAKVGVCPGPQPRLEFGSCCQALPNRPSLVLGCVPLRSAKAVCGVSSTPPATTPARTPPATSETASTPESTTPRPTSTPESTSPKTTGPTTTEASKTKDTVTPTELPRTVSLRQSTAAPTTSQVLSSKTPSDSTWLVVGSSVAVAVVGCVVVLQRWRHRRQVQARADRCAAAGPEPSECSLSPTTPRQPWREAPATSRNRSSLGAAYLDHWVALWFRAARAPTPNLRLPWHDSTAAVVMLPTPHASTRAAPCAWFERPVCADCGIELSVFLSQSRNDGSPLRCKACASLWV